MHESARGRHRQEVGLRLAERDEILQRIHRQRRPDGDDHRRPAEHRDPVEVLDRIVGKLLDDRRIHRERRRCHEHRVAVGVRARDGLGADHAFGAGPVVDHDLLAQALGKLAADIARHDVVAAAGRLRHDDANRFRRIRLPCVFTGRTLRGIGAGCERERRDQCLRKGRLHPNLLRLRSIRAAFSHYPLRAGFSVTCCAATTRLVPWPPFPCPCTRISAGVCLRTFRSCRGCPSNRSRRCERRRTDRAGGRRRRNW